MEIPQWSGENANISMEGSMSGWVSLPILIGEILQENLLQVHKGFLSSVKRLIARKCCTLIRVSVRPLYFPPSFSLPLRIFCPELLRWYLAEWRDDHLYKENRWFQRAVPLGPKNLREDQDNIKESSERKFLCVLQGVGHVHMPKFKTQMSTIIQRMKQTG